MTFIQGRAIRCEPAKAHRTLLISFCPPPSSTPPETFKNIDPRTGIDPTDKSPEWVRIRRPDPRTQYVVALSTMSIAHSFSTKVSYTLPSTRSPRNILTISHRTGRMNPIPSPDLAPLSPSLTRYRRLRYGSYDFVFQESLVRLS